MDLKNFGALEDRLRAGGKKTVVLACAHDEHAMRAVWQAAETGLADFVLVGDSRRIEMLADTLGMSLPSGSVLHAGSDEAAARESVILAGSRKDSLLMKGKMETATLMRAVLDKDTGLRKRNTLSHVAVLAIPAYPKLLAVTDGGMLPHPTLEQKKDIVQNAVDVFRSLGYSCPRIAALAASESVSPRMPETEDAKRLAEMAQEGVFGLCVLDGPVSLDVAFDAELAKAKGISSPVAGNADILLVPDITCGNVLSKALICAGGADMAGCIAGAKVPIILSSRGASAKEKYISILLAAAAWTD